MVTERMTIHKALVELKTMDDRINKAINESKFVFANKHSNQKYLGVPIAECCESIKANYAKITDLIRRRNAIKRAVVQSNAVTTVTIGGSTYTIAEAIDMKNHGMEHKSLLLNHITNNYNRVKLEIDTNNGDKLEAKADAYVTTLYGSSDMKNQSEEVQRVRKDFIAAQSYDMVNPLNVEKIMEELDKEINDFMVEVDSALSVSNALTEIEISY